MNTDIIHNVAISGASGFIGRHVLAELILRKIPVVALTRNSARLREFARKCEILELDISNCEPDVFAQIGKPDILIHLAWGGLPNYKSLHHFETELPVHYKFLKSAIEGGLKTLFVSGTCFEYGMTNGPLSEALETNPQNPYGYAKDALRKQLSFLKGTSNFKMTWGRLFYLYGEGQPETSLYQQLMNAIKHEAKAFNMSGGEQLRDYLPVKEVAQIIVDLSLSLQDIGLINICSGTPISVRKLVEGWLAEKGANLELNLGHYPYPDYEPMAFWGENSHLKAILIR